MVLDLIGLWVLTGCMPDELAFVPPALQPGVRAAAEAMSALQEEVGPPAFEDWLDELYPDAMQHWAEAQAALGRWN